MKSRKVRLKGITTKLTNFLYVFLYVYMYACSYVLNSKIFIQFITILNKFDHLFKDQATNSHQFNNLCKNKCSLCRLPQAIALHKK